MVDYTTLENIDIDGLSRVELGSDLSFTKIVPELKVIRDRLAYFKNKERFLSGVEQGIPKKIFSEFTKIVSSIIDFSVNDKESREQIKERRNVLLDGVLSLSKKSTEELLPLINHIKLSDGEADKSILNLKEKIQQFDNQFSNKLGDFQRSFNEKIIDFDKKILNANENLTETLNIRKKTEEFSIGQLVEKYGPIFSNQAKENKNWAMLSLGFFVFCLLGLISLAIYFFDPLIKELTNSNIANITLEYTITSIVFRLSLLGLSLIFVKESLKNFNANMHLYSLNKHRQNALLSFEALLSNAREEKTRDLIIQEIAHTIYSHQDDGYLRSDKKIISVDQVIELIKNLK